MAAGAKKPLHLGRTEPELALFELQHAAICYTEAFYRYIEMQLARVAGDARLNGQDCVILHAIRLGERPKSIPEIQHFANRTDIANIQYSVKKLVKSGLVAKTPQSAGRGTTYQLTRRGIAVTDEYVKARRSFVEAVTADQPHIAEAMRNATRLLQSLTGAYDQVTRSLV